VLCSGFAEFGLLFAEKGSVSLPGFGLRSKLRICGMRDLDVRIIRRLLSTLDLDFRHSGSAGLL
jgi:hypothetical protein